MTASEAANRYAERLDAPHVNVYDVPVLKVAHVAWGPGDAREAITFFDGVTEAGLHRAIAER